MVNNVPGEEGEDTSHNTAVALIVFSLCCHCLRLPLRLSLSLTHTHTVSSHLIPLANQSVRSESSRVAVKNEHSDSHADDGIGGFVGTDGPGYLLTSPYPILI